MVAGIPHQFEGTPPDPLPADFPHTPTGQVESRRLIGDDDAWPVPESETDIPDDWPERYKVTALRGLCRRLEREPLTGLLTEPALIRHIANDQRQHPGAPRGLIFIDAVNFKIVNAQFGQAGGDNVIQKVAANVVGLFKRGKDGVARIGGDEIVCYVDTSSRDKRTTLQVLEAEIERIEATRGLIIAEYPELDQGSIRFALAAAGMEYDPRMSYAEQRAVINLANDTRKAELHRLYGAYRLTPKS